MRDYQTAEWVVIMVLVLIWGLLTGLLLGRQIEISYQANRSVDRDGIHQLVRSACDASRVSDAVSEEFCGEMQVRYGVEYLCGQTNGDLKNPTRDCWTEDNYNLKAF